MADRRSGRARPSEDEDPEFKFDRDLAILINDTDSDARTVAKRLTDALFDHVRDSAGAFTSAAIKEVKDRLDERMMWEEGL